jgi:GNAT superfamily N-acetyltransferase
MEAQGAPAKGPLGVAVRPLREDELDEADRIVRLAFGTFLGLPDPLTFMGDASFVRTRWRTDPAAALAAEVSGELVGSNFATNWGSFGFFGPLTVRPDLWDRGVARRLLEPTMALFERWGIRHAGLFTFPQSPKHLGLYQSFGFWPRYLTPVLSKAVGGTGAAGWSGYGDAPERDREGYLEACRDLTGAIYDGLDPTGEIRAVQAQRLGELQPPGRVRHGRLALSPAAAGGMALCARPAANFVITVGPSLPLADPLRRPGVLAVGGDRSWPGRTSAA